MATTDLELNVLRIVTLFMLGVTLWAIFVRKTEREKKGYLKVLDGEIRSDYITRNSIAFILVVGMLGFVLLVIMGSVDLKDQSVAMLVGLILGHISSKVDRVLDKLFGVKEDA